ncbi:hypothetical protein DFH28DRAFT_594399 [Melampsora americana]|nr:hypothetical protein DFH28DRAFT_594399 [Melampsora americana]
MATTASKPTLLSSVVPLYAPGSITPTTKQQDSLLHHPYQTVLGSHFDSQTASLIDTNQTQYYSPSGQDLGGNHHSPKTMMSQVPHHQFDHHHNTQSHPQPNHQRHASNASSLSSLSSAHPSHDAHNYSSSATTHEPFGHDAFAVPASYAGSVSAGAAFGGVPVSADSFHQYTNNPHHQHHRVSSISSVSSAAISEGNSPDGMGGMSVGVPGGRKVSQAQMMRRARAHASSPYAIQTDHLSWNGEEGHSVASSASSLMRSSSIASDTPSSTEEEIAEILRSQSRENSVTDWNGNSSHSQSQPPHQTGIGAAGAFMDPYAAVANVHGHGGAFGSTMVNMGTGGLVAGGLVGVGGGMVNTALVGGMGAQMGRMTLDSTETYEALSHHIRTAVTTSASDRARQAFVQAWLNSSYISYTDGNVSRQGLYGSYLRICQQYDIKPINSASFGKAVRQCFPNIKTRRLGVRGNSKYHYCGIRPATAKEAEILMNLSRNEQPEPSHHGSQTASSADDDIDSDCSSSHPLGLPHNGLIPMDSDNSQPQTPRTARPSMAALARLDTRANRHSTGLNTGSLDSSGTQRDQPIPFPNVEEVLSQSNAGDLDAGHAREFWNLYLEHSRSLLESVKSYRFDQFELNLRNFWAGLDAPSRESVGHSVMMSLVYRADAVLYDQILDYLQSQTLSPMPQQAFASLRQLAQSMEQVIIVALESYPGNFVGPKIELAARFGHLIVRHLGICQLAQALSGIFANPQSLKDMVEAWDGIDFEAVRNQAALVTNCQHDTLGHCFDDFRQVIGNPNVTIDNFIQFAECTYERCLQPSLDGERSLSPRSLLVRWCFVSSQLIRDLTLRSAASFGSFQIVNLFFDEWLGFKVLRKVALHVAAVAASVDATSTDAIQQLQSQQSSSMIYLAPDPSSYPSYTINDQAMDQQQLLNDGTNSTSLSGSGATNTIPTTTTGNDNFLFSPTTSQAFAIAQQQASSANGSADITSNNYNGETPLMGERQTQDAASNSSPSGISPNIFSASNNVPNGSQSLAPGSVTSRSPTLSDPHSSSTSPSALTLNKPTTVSSSPSDSKCITPLEPSESIAGVESEEQAFNDLMDVRAFVTSSTESPIGLTV